MAETIIKIEHVSKKYRLGAIGGGTLRGDIQSWWAKVRRKEDPNLKIGLAGSKNEEFLALDDVSLEVKKGERLGIIGYNGAGKSTLLKLLCRVTMPTEGKISFNGRIASMLEVGTGFHAELTGRENIYLNGAILGMTKAEVTAKMEDIIEFSECRKFIDTPVKRYSSGMYVKLAFSVAAHLDCDIMIMDEVLAVGDMRFSQKCLNKMSDLSRTEGKTILYVSHNMNTVRQLCDRCIVMEKGHVIFNGDVSSAIAVYMGLNDDLATHYDYPEHFHTNIATGEVQMLSLDVLDKEENKYQPGEQVTLRLRCRAFKNFEDLRFRFEIQFSDGTVAGTEITSKGVQARENEIDTYEITFDTSHIAPGKYKADLVAYVSNPYGDELMIDGVYPAMRVEIDDRATEKHDLIWSHQHWGHIRLHDAEISLTQREELSEGKDKNA